MCPFTCPSLQKAPTSQAFVLWDWAPCEEDAAAQPRARLGRLPTARHSHLLAGVLARARTPSSSSPTDSGSNQVPRRLRSRPTADGMRGSPPSTICPQPRLQLGCGEAPQTGSFCFLPLGNNRRGRVWPGSSPPNVEPRCGWRRAGGLGEEKLRADPAQGAQLPAGSCPARKTGPSALSFMKTFVWPGRVSQGVLRSPCSMGGRH